jgi:hypothetical protein
MKKILYGNYELLILYFILSILITLSIYFEKIKEAIINLKLRIIMYYGYFSLSVFFVFIFLTIYFYFLRKKVR